jgi:hypothetical protein
VIQGMVLHWEPGGGAVPGVDEGASSWPFR